MVVVMSLGSSEEPMGAGSTYLRVVRSVGVERVSLVEGGERGGESTFPRIDLRLYVKIHSHDDEVRDDV